MTNTPWTEEQVNFLNAWQNNPMCHPYTCGNDRHDEAHTKYADKHGEDKGQLIATTHGWVMPGL